MSVAMGYQLSSIAPYLSSPEQILQSFLRLREIGYRHVQLQSIPPEIPDDFIANALTEADLNCVATQEDYPFGFGDDPDRAIARAVRCGADYLCCALIPRDVDTTEKLHCFAKKLGAIAERVQDAGLIFAFHPIAPDYRQLEGQAVYERLMGLLPDKVQLTFCVHSAFQAGIDPQIVFDKFCGRMDLVHFKDDCPMPDGSRHLMPLGQGVHDWTPILRACHQAGVRYVFAEQERWLTDAFDCAKASLDYLTNIGL